MVEPAPGVEPGDDADRRSCSRTAPSGSPSSSSRSRSTSRPRCRATRTASSTSASCATRTGRAASERSDLRPLAVLAGGAERVLVRLDEHAGRPLELDHHRREVPAAVGPRRRGSSTRRGRARRGCRRAPRRARSARMSLPIAAMWRGTSAPLSRTPTSADDRARTSASVSFGWRSMARHARLQHVDHLVGRGVALRRRLRHPASEPVGPLHHRRGEEVVLGGEVAVDRRQATLAVADTLRICTAS